MGWSKAIALCAILGPLAGCVVHSDVTRFHQLPEKGDGMTVFISSADPSRNASLEFQAYASKIAKGLTDAGYRPVASLRDATLVALVEYGMVGKTTETSAIPITEQTGGGLSTFSGQIGSMYGSQQQFSGSIYTPPTYSVTGYIPVTKDTYHSSLKINIYRFNFSEPNKSPQVFGGIVSGKARTGNFNEVAGCLVSAMFSDFPGKSGGSKKVSNLESGCG